MATSLDFASDANATFDYFSSRQYISEIGMIGHSEAVLIAPLAFDNNNELAFIALLTGFGIFGINALDLILAQ